MLEADWTPRRVSSTRDAAAPRFLPGRRAIVFLQANERLMELDLDTGAERVVAGPWSTSVSCAGTPAVELSLQTDEDVVLDEGARHVCIDLLDRNLNMSSFSASIRVDLAAGTFQKRITWGCGAASTPSRFDCGRKSVERKPAPGGFPYAFDENTGVVRSGSASSFGRFLGWTTKESSPSGRWLVIRGNAEDGDYIHCNLFVIDRLNGAVMPLPRRAAGVKTTWPTPLTSAEMADPSRQRLGERAGDFVGESTVRFVDADTLLAEELLLLLDTQQVVELPGELAR